MPHHSDYRDTPEFHRFRAIQRCIVCIVVDCIVIFVEDVNIVYKIKIANFEAVSAVDVRTNLYNF